ncbi:MAG: stalk domain-containing protein [Caldisericia bacterium]|nr:stalk domain-containing protein [Caldisericia bacterium]
MRKIFLKVCLLYVCFNLLPFHSLFSSLGFDNSTIAQPVEFLKYSTYIGGIDAECIQDICIDQEGCAYITGWTRSDFISKLPSSHLIPGFDQTLNGDTDAFVIKVSADGTDILYASYIGGDNNEVGFCISVTKDKEAYVAGWTQSTENNGFPIGGSIPGYDTSQNHFLDGFVVKISTNGNRVLYSTFIGGYYRDVIFAMELDAMEQIVIAGWTESSKEDGFPIGEDTPGYDTVFHGERDAFILQLSADGSELLHSTYIGGSKDEIIQAIAVDDQQRVFATGWTRSSYEDDFLQTTHQDNVSIAGYKKKYEKNSDAFVLCLSLPSNQMVFNTYIGGSGDEATHSIAIDSEGCCFIVGKTDSTPASGFPILPSDKGFNKTMKGDNDGFLIKLNPSGTDIVYSTYIGGSHYTDVTTDLCISHRNTVFVTGWTDSSFDDGFPVGLLANTIIPGYSQQHAGHFDTYLMEISSDGNQVLYCTYIGGKGPEWAYCLAQDNEGNLYIAGNTETTPENGFPVGSKIPGVQVKFQGAQDSFIWKIASIPVEMILVDITFEVGHPLALVQPSNAIEPVQVELDCHPLFDGKHYMVPLRFIGDSLGASVHWDPVKEVATVYYFKQIVFFWPFREDSSQPNLVVHDLSSKEDTPYYLVKNCIHNGRILFDLQYVEDIFQATYWTDSSGKNIGMQARFQPTPPTFD